MTAPADRFVSAGRLPATGTTRARVEEAHALYRGVDDGSLSGVYPALATVDPGLFGLGVVSTAGELVEVGDARVAFPVMSGTKPFVFALACELRGVEHVRRVVGVNATGMAFDSTVPVERDPSGRTNPMVNAGAIATTSLVTGRDVEDRWATVHAGLCRFAGRRLDMDEATLASALTSNHRNRALANMLVAAGAVEGDPADAVEVYTRQSCLAVTAVDLAVMGARFTAAPGQTAALPGADGRDLVALGVGDATTVDATRVRDLAAAFARAVPEARAADHGLVVRGELAVVPLVWRL